MLAMRSGGKRIRLDCNAKRKKLRGLYEKEGFVCIKERSARKITALHCIAGSLST